MVSVIDSAFVLLTAWHYVKQGYGDFMDNVMRRRENADVRRYLFAGV